MHDLRLAIASADNILGTCADHPTTFYVLDLIPSEDTVKKRSLGLAADNVGLSPVILTDSQLDKLVCAVNDEVGWFSVQEDRFVARTRCDGIVRSLIFAPNHDRIIAIHEIGVTALDHNGAAIWSHAEDVIQSAALDGTTLCIRYDNGATRSFSVLDGAMALKAQ